MSAYRLELWASTFGKFLTQTMVSILLWSALYASSPSSNDATSPLPSKELLLAYYLLVPWVIQIVNGYEGTRLAFKIYDGSLSRNLLYPISVWGYEWVERTTAIVIQALIQSFLLVGFSYLFYPELSKMLFQIFLSRGFDCIPLLILLFVSSQLYFLFDLLFAACGFWIESSWSAFAILRFTAAFLGGIFIPISFFSSSLKTIAMIFPFYSMMGAPIEMFLHPYSWQDYLHHLLIMLLWSGIIWLAAHFAWKKGYQLYTGVGQ
jgi:ABC-type uncharacterized transport system permease subunit